MNDLEQSLGKALPGTIESEVVSDRIAEELENAVNQTSVRHIIVELAKICHQMHEEHPYFNYDKDGIFLAAIADKIEN